jgi:hypothetical protein
MHLFRGSLHSCFGSSLSRLELLCAFLFCRWCRALLPQLEESASWAFCLGCVELSPLPQGTETLSLKWSYFGFCSTLITCLSSLFVFSSSLFYEFVTMCVLSMQSSRGRLRTEASEDQWMVAPWCDEWLTTWCGLTPGRVLQVQVAAWFALVQVKSGRERS